jgi:hypothetical protein
VRWIRCLKSNNFLFLLFLLFAGNNLFAQKISHVSDIIATAYIQGDVSPNQAKIQALNDAKINALKAAGIGEQIKSYQLLFSSQQKNDYTQFFSSDIQSEIHGAVQSYAIKSEKIYCKSEFEIVCEVTVDASVVKYDVKPDISFDANVEGIKAVYNNDDKLTFTVKTTQSCYLTIFNITDKEAFKLYPNDYEKQIQINAFESYKFPIAKIEYTLHTDMKQQETNRLIFVLTKTPIPFIKMDKNQVTTNENIFSWIYAIMPDQRKVEYITLSIQK